MVRWLISLGRHMQAVDTYDYRARHLPVVLAGLPVLWTLAIVIADFGLSLSWPLLTASGVTAAVFMLFGRFARAKGREVQVNLSKDWGGMPATAMLRHRDTRLNPHTKALYHERIRALGQPFSMPTLEEEDADPAAADYLYGAAVDELRRRAKAGNNRAVARENVGYGFARNLYGLKPYALGLAGLCFIALATLALWRSGGVLATVRPIDALALAALVGYAGVFALIVTPSFVRHHAEGYSAALLETAATLPARPRRTKSKSIDPA